VSYEEDTCHMRGIGPSVRVSRELDKCCAIRRIHVIGGGGYVSYLRYQGFCQDVEFALVRVQHGSSSTDGTLPVHMTCILLLI
jgi:hypothetical protein